MPEGDDRGSEPDANALCARRNVGRHHQRIAEELPPPDTKVVLGKPEGRKSRRFTHLRQLPDLGDHLPVVSGLGWIMDVGEVSILHGASPHLVYHNTRTRPWARRPQRGPISPPSGSCIPYAAPLCHCGMCKHGYRRCGKLLRTASKPVCVTMSPEPDASRAALLVTMPSIQSHQLAREPWRSDMIGLRWRHIGAALGCLVLSVCLLGRTALAQLNPVPGGSLNVGLPSDCKTMDPIYSVQFTERQVLYLIFNTLVRYGPDFSIRPELAESWKVEEGGKRITFKLRQGVEFHDGTPFDAPAVKWNIDRRLDPAVASPQREQLDPIISAVEVVDGYT